MKIILALAAVLVLFSPARTFAQETVKVPESAVNPIATSASRNSIPVKLHITVAKYQGEKKVTSIPFTVSLTDNNIWNRIRAGASVPFSRALVPSSAKIPSEYNYRELGLSIDSRAVSLPNGAFQVEITASDTSVVPSDQPTDGAAGVPVFRTISVASTTVLKDGQTTQLSSATDPISGIGMRIDVTLNVTK